MRAKEEGAPSRYTKTLAPRVDCPANVVLRIALAQTEG
jgi:hypothetical protein